MVQSIMDSWYYILILYTGEMVRSPEVLKNLDNIDIKLLNYLQPYYSRLYDAVVTFPVTVFSDP